MPFGRDPQQLAIENALGISAEQLAMRPQPRQA